ncbi:dimethylsulfide dehydrogenase [Ruegeria sp. 2205SS24-7]|uniref:ethylbenzene dehydrogenase-related protein n=1 Tax=Ruegeria discodermiae TaxID=3064389 RepID=UPI0027409F7C|nr:ethylbenzene dehydrogenase-related protein [Ruegeria sp. 2205SS24-7]MDP5220196.1 dimethylsulfide dehydrogenase [Ruegeria sp. 2205SS24-7]
MYKTITCLTALALLSTPLIAVSETLADANVKLLEAYDGVKVSTIPDGIYLRRVNDPDDIIWERLPEYRVSMSPAPAVHESVELRVNYEAEPSFLYMTLARTSERFYVRLRWVDDTPNAATAFDKFRDGAAVQFALGSDDTSYVMGDGPDSAVNIWYWLPGGNTVQNLAAGGPGSTTVLDEQPVSGDSQYINNEGDPNEWTVVMSRPIQSEGAHNASLTRDTVPIAFAVWQGADKERDGLKRVSDGWILLDMTSE